MEPLANSLQGMTALVTGASYGIGRGLAHALHQAGARVAVAARSEPLLQELAAEIGGVPVAMDLREVASIRAGVARAVRELGRLDVLVNNAGRHDFRITTDVTEDEWSRDIALNLGGAFFLSQAAIPHLLESSGNIVNVASVAGVMGEAYSAAYTAAKHGIVGLTKALAIEYLKTPLRVNCVCPGGMDTPQAHTIEVPESADWDLIMRVSAQRGFMSADDVAAVITFLASDDARAVHGSIQVVDLGHTAG
jgi:meso-butanediol dehydrogenase / (S,S)-butanediol dehydrogenase / diacetyl reductase